MKPVEYNLYRNAKVAVVPSRDDAGHSIAKIYVNDKQHTFTKDSRISKALDYYDEEQIRLASRQLQERLSGGQYFFIENELVDFRDADYDGYTHDDNAIDNLMDILGVRTGEAKTRSGLRLNTVDSNYTLVNRQDSQNFQIKGLEKGGDFNSTMLFTWSPFQSYIQGKFEILRLICTNGMVGNSELINSKVPFVNKWEEHLTIANNQMQNKVHKLVAKRLEDMTHTRASVSDMQMITRHASDRFNDTLSQSERDRINNIITVSDPYRNLKGHYKESVFKDKNLASRCAAHVTRYDLYNIITELRTWVAPSAKSTDLALNVFANSILFPTVEKNTNYYDTKPLLSYFSNPDEAFFGA